jgi:hypothetical protein
MACLPLLPSLSALLVVFDGDTGGCHLTTTNGRTHINQSKGGPNSVFTRGMSGHHAKQCLGGFQLLMTKLVDQRVACRTIPKGQDDISVEHAWELIPFL